MEFRPTSPPATVRSRPHGPRAPKLVRKTSIPLDMNSRLEEATPAYYSPRTSSSFMPATPLVPYQRDASSAPSSPRPGTSMEGSRASTPAFKVIPKRPALPTPPPLKFDSVPVSWRAMTLETAQWSMTSEQLQELVSSVIRKSAEESFIRLVPREIFEDELDAELERLELLRATTQSQYRFNMHRRTMLLQSLNALSQSAVSDVGDGEALANLTTQLADITVACDRLMETLLTITDQRAQIQRLQDVHIASALSMALRKLNASYGKRKAELQEARDTIEELKVQLEEAWEAAEDMAQEMDYLDNFQLSDDEDCSSTSAAEVMSIGNVVGITGRAVATVATLTNLPGARMHPGDHANRVSAAKTRSMRTSKASLRVPSRKPSNGTDLGSRASIRRRFSKSSRTQSVSAEGGHVPDVPKIQVDVVSPQPESSFLDLAETRPTTPATPATTPNSTFSETPPVPPMPDLSTLNLNLDVSLQRDSAGSLLALHTSSPWIARMLTGELTANPDSPMTAPTPSPGFRTFIPPDTSDTGPAMRRPRSRSLPRRALSVQISPSTSVVPVSKRRARSEYVALDEWLPPEYTKPKRYSVPLRPLETQTVPAFAVGVHESS